MLDLPDEPVWKAQDKAQLLSHMHCQLFVSTDTCAWQVAKKIAIPSNKVEPTLTSRMPFTLKHARPGSIGSSC